MRDVAGRGLLTRNFKKGLTVDTVGGYLAAVAGLRVLLKAHRLYIILSPFLYECTQVRNNACWLMLEPSAGPGIDETDNNVRNFPFCELNNR